MENNTFYAFRYLPLYLFFYRCLLYSALYWVTTTIMLYAVYRTSKLGDT